VVIDEGSGLPWRRLHFSRTYCELARASGCPDGIWNMDSRAGVVSETFKPGSAPADVMRTAAHTQISTTMLYNCGSVVPSGRAAELRTARREARRLKTAEEQRRQHASAVDPLSD
jgi:hypothetical protein